MYFIILLLFLIYILCLTCNENFNADNLINCYIIHLEKSSDRISNIKNNKLKSNLLFYYWNGVDGDTLNKNDLIEKGILCSKYADISTKNHWGCFLSHKNIIKELADKYNNNELNTKYSIILEDDFIIINDNFDDIISNALNDLESINYDFDILYINSGELDKQIINNIYKLKLGSQPTTEGYIINNKNLKKISDLLGIINKPIDWKLVELINALILNIPLVSQNKKLKSLIDF